MSSNFKRLVWFFLLASTFSLNVLAKKNQVPFVPYAAESEFMTDESYQSLIAQVKKDGPTRQPNQVTDRANIEKMYSPEFLEMKSDFEKIASKKTSPTEMDQDLSAQLDSVLVKWGTKTNLGDQTKWVVAQLRILKAMRGITVRTRPLFERAGYHLPHTFIITFMRSIFAGVDAFLPTQQWRAGLAYISVPYEGMRPDIGNEQELRNFINTEALPMMDKANKELISILFTPSHTLRGDFKPFYFDNEMLYSSANFVSENDRHVLIGKSEVLALLSGSSFAIGGTYISLAYSWDGLLSTMSNLGLAYGMGVFANPANMTAKRRVETLRAHPSLFTLLPTGGVSSMKNAHGFIQAGLQFSKAAWIGTTHDGLLSNQGSYRDMPLANTVPLLDPRALAPFNRIISNGYFNVDELMKNKGMTSALVNGEAVPINFSLLFDSPPNNLRDFLPIVFVGDQDGEKTELSSVKGGLTKTYRNYRYGNPKGWNYSAYTKYFPNANSAAGVRKANQVLAQAWGGFIMAIPLSMNQF